MASIISHAHQDKEDKNIASLIQQFNNPDADVQDSARQSLAEIGEAAVPSLILASGDLDVRVRR